MLACEHVYTCFIKRKEYHESVSTSLTISYYAKVEKKRKNSNEQGTRKGKNMLHESRTEHTKSQFNRQGENQVYRKMRLLFVSISEL